MSMHPYTTKAALFFWSVITKPNVTIEISANFGNCRRSKKVRSLIREALSDFVTNSPDAIKFLQTLQNTNNHLHKYQADQQNHFRFSNFVVHSYLYFMNNRVIVNMGLPMDIRNADGKRATIELNKSNFVICRYHPASSVYLQDAILSDWYPQNWFRKLVYNVKVKTMRDR